MQQRFHPCSRWFELASFPSRTKGQEKEECKGKEGARVEKE
jgi:hypothetical protein